jgi:uncharacterized protein (TIGR02001 family)
MQKLQKTLLVAGLASLPFAASTAHAEDAPYSLTAKLALYSEYEYRGIAQTSQNAAVQANLDFAHSSGLYLGTFLSNIKWLKDTADVNGFDTNAKLEWDIYGGYKFEVMKDVTLDVGYLRYEYPSSSAFNPKPNTDEVYIGASFGPMTLKYSYSINDTFGVTNSDGSQYIELSANPQVSEKVTLNAILGYQKYAGTNNGFDNNDLSYAVYKFGATYDIGKGWAAGGYYKNTTADSNLYTVKGKDWGAGRLVGFVTYSF